MRLTVTATMLLVLMTLLSPPARAAQGETLTLRQAVEEALSFSPVLKASGERIEQAKGQLWQAYSVLLPFVQVQGTYTRADSEIKLEFGDMSDLYTLALSNCFGWDDTLMGPRPAMCDTLDRPAAETTEDDGEGGGARVIQQLNNFDASLSVGMSLVNLRTIPLIQNVYSGQALAHLQKEYAEEQLVYAVVQLYYGVSTAQAAIDLARENLATAMRHLDFTATRLKAGVALDNERIRASLNVLQARNGMDKAMAGYDLARRSLATMIGREEAAFAVEEFPENPWADAAAAPPGKELLEQRLDIRMMEKAEEMAERQVTDIWLKFAPTLQGVWAFSASTNKGFADRYSQWRAMVTLNWSILEGGMRFAEADIARAKVREARFQREAALVKAKSEAETALAHIKTARTDLETAQEMIKLAHENLALVEKQYKHGAAQQTVLLDAQLQFQQSEIQALQGRLQLALAQSALAKAIGLFSHFDRQ